MPAPTTNRKAFQITIVAGLLLLGLLPRLAGLPLQGTGDMRVWKVWAYRAATAGLTQAYPVQTKLGDTPPLTLHNLGKVFRGELPPARSVYDEVAAPTDYPPGTIYVLWLVGKIYQAFFAPDFANGDTLTALIKLPIVLADLALTLLLFRLISAAAPGRRGRSAALFAAGAYWLNPAAVVAGSVLAYLDALYGLALVAATGLLALRRYSGGWLAWGAALMIKPQALFVAVTMLLLTLRHGLARLLVYGLAAAALPLLLSLPFLLRGTLIGVLAGMRNNAQEDYLSGNQANIWWVWSFIWQAGYERKGTSFVVKVVPPSIVKDLGVADLNLWAISLFLAFVAATSSIWWLSTRGRRAGAGLLPDDLFLVVLHLYGATMLLPSIHENHLLAALPLLALVAGLRQAHGGGARPYWLLLGAMSAVVTLNLVLFYGFGARVPGPLPRMWFGVDSTVPLAIANVALFCVTLAAWGVTAARFTRFTTEARRHGGIERG